MPLHKIKITYKVDHKERAPFPMSSETKDHIASNTFGCLLGTPFAKWAPRLLNGHPVC